MPPKSGDPFPDGSVGKESACNEGDIGFDPWIGKIRCRREWQPTPVFWPGESHGLVHGVAKSQTQLRDFCFHFFTLSESVSTNTLFLQIMCICLFVYLCVICVCVSTNNRAGQEKPDLCGNTLT